LRASDALAVLDELGVQEVDYFGHSLGGRIGFGLAKCALERFRSFIFIASHPYAENLQPFRDLIPRDRDAFSVIVDQVFGSRLTSTMRTRLLANDLDALRTLTQDRESNADVMTSMIIPCLLIVENLIRASCMCGNAHPTFRTRHLLVCRSAIMPLLPSAANV
jgi:pimeloyl-ACP methyl ester carboxylesterase